MRYKSIEERRMRNRAILLLIMLVLAMSVAGKADYEAERVYHSPWEVQR